MARPHQTLAAWLLTAVWTDLRFAIRSSRAAPAVTAVATVVLALGIAANTLVFSVIETTLLRPVPYDQPRRTGPDQRTIAGVGTRTRRLRRLP